MMTPSVGTRLVAAALLTCMAAGDWDRAADHSLPSDPSTTGDDAEDTQPSARLTDLTMSSNRSSGLHYIDFVAKHGRLYANGEPFYLKGVNWFGSESRVGPPGGLNIHSISWYMDFLARHGFNAIRLLFNHESILSNALVETSELLAAPELKGANYLAMFGRIAREAARRGLLVMLACHRIHPSAWPGDGLWYDRSGPITEASVLQSWDAIAAAFCDAHWNVFAVDLQNDLR